MTTTLDLLPRRTSPAVRWSPQKITDAPASASLRTESVQIYSRRHAIAPVAEFLNHIISALFSLLHLYHRSKPQITAMLPAFNRAGSNSSTPPKLLLKSLLL
jgi:hypothetical protein